MVLCNFGACAGTYTSTVSVSLAASDGVSGVASTYYTTDGSDPTTSPTRIVYSAPILLAGTTAVRFSSTDNVGNVEAPQSQTVTITPQAGINLVQETHTGGSTGTITAALQSASLPGDTLVAVVALAAGSSAKVSTVTDSSGATWSAAPVVGYLTGTNSRVEIWYRVGAPSVTSVTVSLSAAKSAAVSVSEWSGVAGSSQPDKAAGGSGASATTISTAPGFSTLNPTDLIIAATNYPAAATATLTSSGWTPLPSFPSSSVHETAAYQITTSTGSYQATWNLTALSGGHGTAILALKAA
ncbi:MAG: hypothetical protein E6G14_03670 [Actinobacteria bacterium]|nr:MAG: hypothetical protein E6G14_03670 [Actinomycetota bacterium]